MDFMMKIRFAIVTAAIFCVLSQQASGQSTINLVCETQYTISDQKGISGPTSGEIRLVISQFEVGILVIETIGGPFRGCAEFLGSVPTAAQNNFVAKCIRDRNDMQTFVRLEVDRYTGEFTHALFYNGKASLTFTGKCTKLGKKLF
jgi:hypothetical protein